MANSDMIPPNINAGRALYGMHALWASVMDHIGRATGNRIPWDDVDFDKLAHCIHLIWQKLSGHEKPENEISCLEKGEKVSFKSPYESAPGIHGPGPALWTSQTGMMHAIKAIKYIQTSQDVLRRNPDIFIFTIEDRKFNRHNVSLGRDRTWLPLHLAEDLPPAFHQIDRQYQSMIAETLSKLSRPEIRALGTHQSKQNTIEAIEYNIFIQLFRKIIIRIKELMPLKNVSEVNPESRKHIALPSIDKIIEEIRLKAEGNRQNYEEAYNKIKYQAEKEGDQLATIMLTIFEQPQAIWNSSEVLQWRRYCEIFDSLFNYISSLESNFKTTSREKSELKADSGNKARKHIGDSCGIWFPLLSTEMNMFDWKGLLGSLIKFFEKLPHSTDYYTDYRIKSKIIKTNFQL